jgi:hypothetical protein
MKKNLGALMCSDLITELSNHFLPLPQKKYITRDETPCFPMTRKANGKACSGTHQQLKDKKTGTKTLHITIKLVTIFDIMGTTHSEFISKGQTANQAYYEEI